MAGNSQRENGFFFLNGNPNETRIVILNDNQSQNWFEIDNSAGILFAIPSNGILPVAYGGTGATTLSNLMQLGSNPTYTTNALNDTNHLWAIGFGTDTGYTNVNTVFTRRSANIYTSTNGTLLFTNTAAQGFILSNSVSSVLYTNTSFVTNQTWVAVSGTASAGTVSYMTNTVITTNLNSFILLATNNPTIGDFAAPGFGNVKVAVSNYDLYYITPYKTNLVSAGK